MANAKQTSSRDRAVAVEVRTMNRELRKVSPKLLSAEGPEPNRFLRLVLREGADHFCLPGKRHITGIRQFRYRDL